MALRRMASRVGAAAALALALQAPGPTLAQPSERRAGAGLAGQLLVAAPTMKDPRFARTVLYMVKHDAGGALGLIVNRPFKEVPIADLMARLGLEHEGVRGSMRMHYGGPVEPGRILVLHTADYRAEGTEVVAGGFAVTAAPGILRAVGTGAGPRRALLFLSYSGWGPGQLDRELRSGDWIALPAETALVFDDEYETKWERAMERRTRGKVDL